MSGVWPNEVREASAALSEARRDAAASQARLAGITVRYANARIAADRDQSSPRSGAGRSKPGEFVADEMSVLLRQQPWSVRCLVARSRRLMEALPTVWSAFCAGDLDDDQVRMIDRIARRATEAATLAVIDDESTYAAQTRTPKQLGAWLLRLVVRLEPEAFASRHRRALADRRVTIVQGPDGMGYVTGEVSAVDAAAIDAMLTTTARSLGADDHRIEQQRRADLFADLLLGRLELVDNDLDEAPRAGEKAREVGKAPGGGTRAEKSTHDSSDERRTTDDQPSNDQPSNDQPSNDQPSDEQPDDPTSWLEVEDIDPDTGDLLGTRWQRVDVGGSEVGMPVALAPSPGVPPVAFRRRPQTIRIGVVVPLSSLLGLTDTPGELADRSGCVAADQLRRKIAYALAETDGGGPGTEVLFTRLLTDDGGRLLDTTELGRYPSRRLAEAIRLRAGTCAFPTCTVPAEHCDCDHHDPVPRGPTVGANLDPACRRHHRGKTFAWLASLRGDDTVEWTMPDASRYRCVDEPLPSGIDRLG